MQAKEIQQKELNSTKSIFNRKKIILLSYTERQQQIYSAQIYKLVDRLYSTDVTKKNIFE